MSVGRKKLEEERQVGVRFALGTIISEVSSYEIVVPHLKSKINALEGIIPHRVNCISH